MVVEYIKSLKEAKKTTVKDLSNLTNIPESTINNILSRKTENPSFDVVSRLVLALDGSMDELTGIKKGMESGNDLEAIKAIREIYENQIASLRDDKQSQIASLNADKRALFCLLGVIIVAIIFFLGFDLLNGSIGWFRYQ